MQDERKDANGLYTFRGIARDLWGDFIQPLTPMVEDSVEAAAVEIVHEKAEQCPKEPPAQEAALPKALEAVWKTADPVVDWTEALASPVTKDPHVPQKDWDFYHEKAAMVLQGDVATYEAVLTQKKPLDDLLWAVEGLTCQPENADTLQVAYTCKETEAEKIGSQLALAGLSLRMARDLFALLPVVAVTVSAKTEAETLEVTFHRRDFHNLRFGFVDPVALVTSWGGVFQPAQKG